MLPVLIISLMLLFIVSCYNKDKEYPLYLFSPTYALASYLKKDKSPEEKSNIIKNLNKRYFLLTVILTIIICFADDIIPRNIQGNQYSPFRNSKVIIENLMLIFLMSFAVLYWSLSRCNEIMFAFAIDTYAQLSPKRNKSSLKYYERISLAVTSYFELILLFSLIFFFIPILALGSFKGMDYLPILNALYFSGVTVTTLGYGDISPETWLPQFLTVYEVLCGFSLIIVSFTVYLSKSIELKEYLPSKRSIKSKLKALKRRKR